jgi:hypothetical protein
MMGSAPPRVRRTTLPTPRRLVPAADEAAARLGSDPSLGLAAAAAAAGLLAAVALWPALRARLGLSSLTASGGLAAAAAGLAAGAVAAAWSRYNRPPEDDG